MGGGQKMSNLAGTFTLASTGQADITGLGFQPNDLTFRVGAKLDQSGAIQAVVGEVDENGNQFVLTNTFDGTNRQSKNVTPANDRCIKVWEWDGSAYAVVLEVEFVSYLSTGFRLNVITANSDYRVFVKARTT